MNSCALEQRLSFANASSTDRLPLPGQCALVASAIGVSDAPLLFYWINEAVKREIGVALLSARSEISHFSVVAKRCNVDLPELIRREAVVFNDLLSDTLERALECSADKELVVVDGLDFLVSSGCATVTDAIESICFLQEHKRRVIISCYSDQVLRRNPSQRSLLSALIEASTSVFTLRPLTTGDASNVSGIARRTRGGRPWDMRFGAEAPLPADRTHAAPLSKEGSSEWENFFLCRRDGGFRLMQRAEI